MFSKYLTAAAALSLQAAHAQVVAPAPISSVGSGSNNGVDCGSCYVAVQYLNVVFGTETITAQPTQTVVAINGMNSTVFTTLPAATTAVSEAAGGGQFTINPSGGVGGATTVFDAGQSTLVVNGVTVTSPNAVEIITSYEVVSETFINGQCSPVATGAATNVAYTLSAGMNQEAFLSSVEEAFASHIGPLTCSPGGGSGNTVTAIPGVTATGATTITSSRAGPSPASVSSMSSMSPSSIGTSLLSSAVPTSTAARNTTTVASSSSSALPTITPLGGLPSGASYITIPANGTSTYYGGGGGSASQATAMSASIVPGAAAKLQAGGLFAAVAAGVMGMLV